MALSAAAGEYQPEEAAVRVLISNCMHMVRDELRRLIDDQPDMQFVEDVDGEKGGLRQVEKLSPDVVVLDFQNSFLRGTETVNRMLALKPDLKIIALSMHSDPRYLNECLSAGVWGYVLKDCACEELVDAVRKVAADQVYLSPSIRTPESKDL
jgi:DNA-binding NarL/FixJ family response regulator